MNPTVWLLIGTLLFAMDSLAQPAAAGSPYKARDFGAQGDGTAMDTASVQKAIDACAAGGGGTVYLGPGVYLCGGLRLKNGVYLYLDAGCTIKGSPTNSDYEKCETLGFKNHADSETSFFHFSLIWAEDAEHIGVLGEGTIDSNYVKRHGPKTIAFKRCRFVDIKGVRLLNAPNYNISLLGTDYVNIDGVTILNGFADGIDPDACRNVRISNCHIESRDDAIVPKTSFSLGERRSCENITVANCFLASRANCFKLGTESGGDFKHITVANCVMSNFAGETPGRQSRHQRHLPGIGGWRERRRCADFQCEHVQRVLSYLHSPGKPLPGSRTLSRQPPEREHQPRCSAECILDQLHHGHPGLLPGRHHALGHPAGLRERGAAGRQQGRAGARAGEAIPHGQHVRAAAGLRPLRPARQ